MGYLQSSLIYAIEKSVGKAVFFKGVAINYLLAISMTGLKDFMHYQNSISKSVCSMSLSIATLFVQSSTILLVLFFSELFPKVASFPRISWPHSVTHWVPYVY